MRETDLADLIYEYGEEPASRRIARAIVRAREQSAASAPPPSSPRSCAAPRPAAAGPASTPRPAPSRRCASASTASSTGLAEAVDGRGRLPDARRPPRRDRLPLPRGPRGEGGLPLPRHAGLPRPDEEAAAARRGRGPAEPARPQRPPARARARGGGGVRDEGVVRLGKPIDNSRVVRQVDPRSRREIWLADPAGGGARRRASASTPGRRSRSGAPGLASVDLDREKERLVEENRKLRLEKAALENLRPRGVDRAPRPRPARPRPRAVGGGRDAPAPAARREDRGRGAAARGARRARVRRCGREVAAARAPALAGAAHAARAPDAPAADAARAHRSRCGPS